MPHTNHFTHILHLSSSLVQIFHDVAYKAKDRNDLVAGIDEFLDQVTVLPPGEWDPSIRIEPPKNVPSQVTPYLHNKEKINFFVHICIFVPCNIKQEGGFF